MSKFNSVTSFLYQLFKENSNFIVLKPCKVIHLSIFFKIFIIIYIYSYVYFCIYTPSYQHFKAFPVSKFNSETSFLYQLFKENSNFTVKKAMQGYFFLLFWCLCFLYLFLHFKSKLSRCLKSIPRQVFCINFSRRIQIS